VSEVEVKRNPETEQKDLEIVYQNRLGMKKIIWLPVGLEEDATTSQKVFVDKEADRIFFTPFTPGGHIDEFCRFADEHTILLAEVMKTSRQLHPIEIDNAKILEQCYQILSQETDTEGQPFTIVRVPTPVILIDEFAERDPFYDFFISFRFEPNEIFRDGHFPQLTSYPIIVSASYLNFIKINKVVLIPSYWKEGLPEAIKEMDDCAYNIFKTIFPSHKIVQIDTYNVNLAGGGMHCMTLNEPR
jgi:agmatine deiminase